MRLIDADAAIDALQKEINKVIPPFDDVMGSIRCGVRLARNIIEDLPSAQKTGRWIEEHIDITDKEHPKSFRFYRCSVCSHVAAPALFVDKEKWLSYCPHCGAYMKGENDG